MKVWRSPVWGPCIGAAVALIALGALFGLPLARGSVSKQKLNVARKLLEKIKLVDGEGSGLDADTVRGSPFAYSGLLARNAVTVCISLPKTRNSDVSECAFHCSVLDAVSCSAILRLRYARYS